MKRCTLLLLACSLGGATDIAGRWRPLQTSKGGIGMVLDFSSKGVLWAGTGAVVDSVYAIEGSELMIPGPTVSGPPSRLTIDLREAGLLRLWKGTKLTMELTRVGEPSEGILGEWLTDREMGKHRLKMRIFFREGGKYLLIMPFRSDRGTWRAQGERVSVTLPDGRLWAGKKIGAERLVFENGYEYRKY
jgi:hypothetical protein